jgi:hypothetical protein
MICRFCSKSRCAHVGPHQDRPATMVERTMPCTQVTEAASVEQPRYLFELCGLRDRRCVLCQYLVPSGPHETALQHQHGRLHVSRGEAVSIRRGLPPGVVRFQVAKDTT